MISPARMKIIQIEVTNACIHHCSNCTRFCGLHEKNFMMTPEEFRKAVDSLQEFPGVVGVMGGEPTLNPHFAEMVKYLHAARPNGRKAYPLKSPVPDFNRFHREHWNSLSAGRRGLWSALGKRYYENLELIADVFPYQCLNDHKNVGMHQALLLPRRELGIPDDIWFPLRDKCWIQNEWSAAVTPKGAFFCEIAAALDMLFDGPGGWPVEPGWWRRKPEEFGAQLQWCEYCSAALAVPRIAGNAERDIISPGIWEKIKERRKAWKVANGRCTVFDTAHYDASAYKLNYDGEPYLSEQDVRVSQDTGSSLFPNRIAVWDRSGRNQTLPLDKFQVIGEKEARELKFEDWLLILDASVPVETLIFLGNAVFNPGVLYYSPRRALMFLNRRASALHSCQALPLAGGALKRLFPRSKRHCWWNWLSPEKESMVDKWQRWLQRGKDSWRYRSGLMLQYMRGQR